MASSMLSIRDMSIYRGERGNGFFIGLPALQVQAGEVYALCGDSGCGKSTVLEMIGLTLKPQQLAHYSIQVEGEQVELTSDVLEQNHNILADLRAHYFGFMLQTGGLLPFLTVKENIALSSQMVGKPLDDVFLEDLIQRLDISRLLNSYPKQLSIGQRQRVSFIRSIAHKPSILLTDEPTAALDPQNSVELFNIILEVVQKYQIAAIVVTHNKDLLEHYSEIHQLVAQLQPNSAVFREV